MQKITKSVLENIKLIAFGIACFLGSLCFILLVANDNVSPKIQTSLPNLIEQDSSNLEKYISNE